MNTDLISDWAQLFISSFILICAITMLIVSIIRGQVFFSVCLCIMTAISYSMLRMAINELKEDLKK